MAKKDLEVVQYHDNEVVKSSDLIAGENLSLGIADVMIQYLLDTTESTTHIITNGLLGAQASPVSFNVDFSYGSSFGHTDSIALVQAETTSVAFTSADTSDRYDTVEIRSLTEDEDLLQRSFIDGITGITYLDTVYTRSIKKIEFQVVAGVPGAGIAPSTSSGWYKLCEVLVEGSSSGIIDANIFNADAPRDGVANTGWTNEASTVTIRLGNMIDMANGLEALRVDLQTQFDAWLNQDVRTTATPTFTGLTSLGQTILAKDSGNVLIGTIVDPGETLHVGSGGARFTGTVGSFAFDSTGATLQSTLVGHSGLACTDAAGFFSIWTGGRILSTPEANVNFNVDKSTTFNGAVKVDTISENATDAGVTIEDAVVKHGGISIDDNYSVLRDIYVTFSSSITTATFNLPCTAAFVRSVTTKLNTGPITSGISRADLPWSIDLSVTPNTITFTGLTPSYTYAYHLFYYILV